MASHHPYYRKWLPSKKNEQDYRGDGKLIDLTKAWIADEASDPVTEARALFDDRAAAAIRAAAAVDGTDMVGPPRIWPVIDWRIKPPYTLPLEWFPNEPPWFHGRDLLEMKWYDGKAPTIHIPRSRCLALLAYLDFFPGNPRLGLGLRSMVSRAVLSSTPGWCGTFGPGVDDIFSLKAAEGNYDMSQMHLLPMVYRHYDDLSPAAREHLITQLLANGRVHRPRKDDTFTSAGNPDDWSRAGFTSFLAQHRDIGETENHILMIVTARYLTNQLLYQRDGATAHDNRRNGGDDIHSCFSLLLYLLRNMLRGDFSEYNAKGYQSETRWALLNLCTYAYDHEVRLGARMVLDYISAHMAVSTNNLRRLVPFRRRLTELNTAHTSDGFMNVGLLASVPIGENRGADPMGPYFAMQAGNIKGYTSSGFPGSDADLAMEVLSDYRIPPSIHDLFMNDKHRRFFQRLHRTPRDEVGGNRNCDNMEIYAGSPSYLITAGGAPALWAINPYEMAVIDGESVSQQLGLAVTTNFMPTGFRENEARGLIQFGAFSKLIKTVTLWEFLGFDVTETNTVVPQNVENYGVAPDFACGPQVFLPPWVSESITEGVEDGVPQNPHISRGFSFVNMGRTGAPGEYAPGFYLAIYQETPGGFALMEAFDTWLNPGVTFKEFKNSVLRRNHNIRLMSNVVTRYTTKNNNQLDFVVWANQDGHRAESGAKVIGIQYENANGMDALGHAENTTTQLVNGTIMNSLEEAKIEIRNPSLGTTILLDFTDQYHPLRFDSQTGEFEVAGFNNEVWLDFEYLGSTEGDVCRPFNTIDSAVAAVADGGVIRIVPGATLERGSIGGNKSFKLVAPIGDVTIGTSNTQPMGNHESTERVSNHDVWVQFDWQDTTFNHVPYLFDSIAGAVAAVADGGVVNIQPGSTNERLTIGSHKRFSLVAPIGGVKIGLG